MAIANRLARAIYLVLGGDKYRELGYMRGDPHERKIERLVNQLKALNVDITYVRHQMIVSDRKITAEKTGIVLD